MGDVGRVIFKDLITLEEAIARLESELPPKPKVIEVGLNEALSKVLAEDVKAPINTPPYPRSLVDGYVVNYLDVKEASEDRPVKLKVKGRVRVGDYPDITLRRGESVEIDTGAVIPEGGNAVVPVEETKCIGDYVLIYRSVGYGENIAWPGSDVCTGELVATRGTLITPELIGVLASLGISKVKVFWRPKVCVISTGNELVEPGSELVKGKVYDVNTYVLTSKLRSLGYECVSLGVVPDNEDELRKVVGKAIDLCDVVV
ncbi:MAG: molybdopterin biosynthesis protein, partial [Thermoprotei archaeon]